MNISDFDYPLPEGRIAKFPLGERDASRLLVWRGGNISETAFRNIVDFLPSDSTLVFNDTRVVRARLAMFKPASGQTERGARVEILCLEPHLPADYEGAFAARGESEWRVMIGGAKRWKSGPVEIRGERDEILLRAWRERGSAGVAGKSEELSELDGTPIKARANEAGEIVRFEWTGGGTFGELLEKLGSVPIPPYLDRDTQQIDTTRYQTVYAAVEGSVAAPTAGLHFTPELIERITEPHTGPGASERPSRQIERVTLHVGAGTFLPVKSGDALAHGMHTEHFEVSLGTVERLSERLRAGRKVVAVGTTSVRTLESLAVLGWRLKSHTGQAGRDSRVEQFGWREMPDDFDGATALAALVGWMRGQGLDTLRGETRIMITPGYKFRIVGGLVTNFHQPKSTLLLLVSAFTGGRWREIYDYALGHDFRFLSYGDSSLLLP